MTKINLKYPLYFILIFVLFSSLVVLLLKWFNPKVTSYINIKSARTSSFLFYRYEAEIDWVSFNNISPNVVKAILVSEDQKFYVHHGFDVTQIEHAIEEYNEGKRLRGASTITQQLARNIFLSPSKNILRKAMETYFTFLMELILTKKRILELYLNTIEMGKNIYGIGRASKVYFNKDAKYLTRLQSALIAAALPNPVRRNPAKPSVYMIKRSKYILRLMKSIRIPR